MSLPFAEKADICDDPIKGRCLVARREFKPGDLLWIEPAYVFASADEDDETAVEADAKLWTVIAKNAGGNRKKKKKGISMERAIELTDALVELESVRSLDTARCLMQLLARTASAGSTAGAALTNADTLFLHLQPSNLERCTRDISTFREEHPGILPEAIPTALAARILGVLNNNQMELEDIVGSGLFVATAILEHDCGPNCSFSTSGSNLYLVATTVVNSGDRLSIDYGNNYCRPTFYRRVYLYKTYGFFCDCTTCVGADKTRRFLCPGCRSGSVCASDSRGDSAARAETAEAAGSGVEPDAVFIPGFSALTACDLCLEVPPPEFVAAAAQAEEDVVRSGIVHSELISTSACGELSDQIQKLLHRDGCALHELHYLMFWAADRMAEFSSHAAAAGLCAYGEALQRAAEVERLMNAALPALHHEKVVMLDKMGQLAVANGDISEASAYFAKACSISALVCGADNPSTVKLNTLAMSTPTSVEELMTHYAPEKNGSDAEDDAEWEDDADS